MKVRMLRDWGFYRKGQDVEVFEPVAIGWINSGAAERVSFAEPATEERVDRTLATEPAKVERATKHYSRKR